MPPIDYRARKSDHNPDPDGTVDAVDLTHDPAHGADMRVISKAIVNDPRVAYVIFNGRIWNPSVSRSWRPYSGSNPHRTHMHVSVRDDRQDDASLWPFGTQEDDMSEIVVSVAQCIRMNPHRPGCGLKMDLWGGMHPVGDQPVPTDAPYWRGQWSPTGGPVAVSFDVIDWGDGSGSPAGYTLDCKGAVHGWGGMSDPPPGAYWADSPWRVELG